MSGLSVEQRDAVLKVVERRLRKLDDEALLQVERLTRKPEEAAALVPVSSAPPAPRKSERPRWRAPLEAGEVAPPGTISRRHLLTVGGAAALVGGAGYELGSGQRQRAITEMREKMLSTIGALDPDMDELGDIAMDVASESLEIHEAATDFGDRYPALRDALESWTAALEEIGANYEVMQSIEGSIQAVTQVLAQVASSLRGAVKLPFGLSLEFLNLENLGLALSSASAVLQDLPKALDGSDGLRRQLTHWVSEDPAIDVDTRLLRAVEDSFCPQAYALASKCLRLEERWQAELVEPLEDVRSADSRG